MAKLLQILIVEDSADDAGLVARHIEHAGYKVHWERVEDAATLKSSLDQQPWDVILCDHSMPGFSGTDALAIVRASGRDLPFIFVSGRMGEYVAAEAMKAGAHDYVMKSNLKRLVPAVEREVREAEGRRKHRQVEEDLRVSNAIVGRQSGRDLHAQAGRRQGGPGVCQ
jgi:DNA-binding NtrC family response regulator